MRNIILLLLSLPLITFCSVEADLEDGSDLSTISEEAEHYLQAYEALKLDKNISDTFLFFTDPHLLRGQNYFGEDLRDNIENSFKLAKELYRVLSLDFCLCGGDWLNSGDSLQLAKRKIILADNLMKSFFSKYYKMLGNHDTNYQGIVSGEDHSRGDFSRTFIDNEYFRETGSAYYTFKGRTSEFIVFDSGLDWFLDIDGYKREQLLWFANLLENGLNDHIILGLHMFSQDGITPFSAEIVNISDAFNNKQSIGVFGTTFDYSRTSGKIHFILTGHNHTDSIGVAGKTEIPVIQTLNYDNAGTPSFDICLVDYGSNILELLRVGNGINRTIKLMF